jgi:hypothetical protein
MKNDFLQCMAQSDGVILRMAGQWVTVAQSMWYKQGGADCNGQYLKTAKLKKYC